MFQPENLNKYEYIDYEREAVLGLKSFVNSCKVLDKIRNKKIPDKKRNQVRESLSDTSHWYKLASNALLQVEGKTQLERFWDGMTGKMKRFGVELEQIEKIKQTVLRLTAVQKMLQERWPELQLQSFDVKGSNLETVNLQKTFEQGERDSDLRTGRISVLAIESENLEVETPKIFFEENGQQILVSVVEDFDEELKERGASVQVLDQGEMSVDKMFYVSINSKSYDSQSGEPKIKKISQAVSGQLEALIQ